MSRQIRFSDLFFENGRRRLGQNLGFKLGLGCVSVILLACCACLGISIWFFWTFFSGFPFRGFDRSRPLLVFNPNTLPAAQVETRYEAAISIEENVTPVIDFYLVEGSLPPGLELKQDEADQDMAHISGTPEKAGTYTFTINVGCYGTNVSGQTGSKEYTIVVEEK